MNDPLEPVNRQVFAFNIWLDDNAIKPVAIAYRRNVPEFFQDRIRDFFENYKSPVTFANDVLQLEFGRAAETATRFFINSVAGVGGLFDVAGQYGLKRHKEDFGQTLAVWGMPEGPYLMLPLLGPSNPRDVAGMVADSFANPWSYLYPSSVWVNFTYVGDAIFWIDVRARNIENLDDVRKNSLDYYAAIRSLYRQYRQSEILNGKTPSTPVPGDDE
ncbi:MAG: VacJ family lipoprotein [Alphaproteobacteria bacterium]